mgnify:CR=1 FL=1
MEVEGAVEGCASDTSTAKEGTVEGAVEKEGAVGILDPLVGAVEGEGAVGILDPLVGAVAVEGAVGITDSLVGAVEVAGAVEGTGDILDDSVGGPPSSTDPPLPPTAM